MNNKYWINDWAKFRQAEIVQVPPEYKIHSDYTFIADEGEIRSAFAELNALYLKIFDDIIKSPEEFGMPMHERVKYRWFSSEWRDSGTAPFRPFILLYNLLISGEIVDQGIHVSIEKYNLVKSAPRNLNGSTMIVKQAHFLFDKFNDYGFMFEGLKNNKTVNSDITINYPDNTVLLRLLKTLADKANKTGRLFDFLRCTFRLLTDDINTINYGCVEETADNLHTEWEKEFIYKMDKTLMSMNLFRKGCGGYEGPGLAYYHSKKLMESNGPYTYRMISRSADVCDLGTENMILMLRIRNVSRCFEYLENCPASVKQIFTGINDTGCGKRKDNSCKHGIAYVMNNKKYWRCGCCHAAFQLKPKIVDIPHYIKLVELGEKK